MTLLLSDLDIAARTIAGETRGEFKDGQIDVAHVLLNRWRETRGQFRMDHTLAATCLRWKQFSCWNHNDPNRLVMEGLTANDEVYRMALHSLLEAIDSPADRTLGSKHYSTIETNPSWAADHKPCYTNGGHKFWNSID